MRAAEPVTQTMNVSDAGAHWGDVVEAVSRREKRIVLEMDGTPIAALVSAQDLDRLRRYDAEREADFAIIDRMRNAFKDVPDEELEREIAKAVAEARAELRAERKQTAQRA